MLRSSFWHAGVLSRLNLARPIVQMFGLDSMHFALLVGTAAMGDCEQFEAAGL